MIFAIAWALLGGSKAYRRLVHAQESSGLQQKSPPRNSQGSWSIERGLCEIRRRPPSAAKVTYDVPKHTGARGQKSLEFSKILGPMPSVGVGTVQPRRVKTAGPQRKEQRMQPNCWARYGQKGTLIFALLVVLPLLLVFQLRGLQFASASPGGA